MNAADVDALLPAPAVVLGSLPPQGRDLDLLVPEALLPGLGAILRDHGWVADGDTFVRFAEGTAFAVDLFLSSAGSPTPPPAGAAARGRRPSPGYRHLLAPSAPHRLLLLAHRLDQGMVVDERRAARLATLRRRHLGPRARPGRAVGSGRRRSSDCSESPATRDVRRARRLAEPPPSPGAGDLALRPRRRREVDAGRAPVPSPGGPGIRRGGGVDQARSRPGPRPGLRTRSKRSSRVVARVRGRAGAVPGAASSPSLPTSRARSGTTPVAPGPPRTAATGPGSAVRLLSWGWSCVVALANARTHRRARPGAPRRGPDLRPLRPGLGRAPALPLPRRRATRPPRWLVRRLSPAPRAAFFLDVPPAAARARKPEQYTTRDLTRLRGLYVEESAQVGRQRGRRRAVRSPSMAAAIAEEAWRALRRPGRLGRLKALLSR